MSKIKIKTSFNIELDFELAGLMQRLLGWLIDLVVQIAYLVIMFRLAAHVYIGSKKEAGPGDSYNLHAIQIILTLPVLLYHLLNEMLLNGQSIGKKILGIRVISELGNRPSFYQFLLRWLLRPFEIDFFLIPAFLSMLISKRNQRLGDVTAGTLVIVSRVKTNINDTVFFDLDEAYKPRYSNVLQLSDRDMNIIKTILDTSLKEKNYTLAERTSAKIRTALKITDYQPPLEFLETVLKDYNYLSDNN